MLLNLYSLVYPYTSFCHTKKRLIETSTGPHQVPKGARGHKGHNLNIRATNLALPGPKGHVPGHIQMAHPVGYL